MAASPVGRLVIISGPSGAGKTTIVRRLINQCRERPLVLSVSATTRPPRQGEQDGVDYHFLSREEFERRRQAGEFLECAEVYGRGHWYGTLRSTVATGLEAGKWVVLEIDVEGASQVIPQFPDAMTIFIRPPDLESLEHRLRSRRTENEETIGRRLAAARHEWQAADTYQHQVVNHEGQVEQTVALICDILKTAEDPA